MVVVAPGCKPRCAATGPHSDVIPLQIHRNKSFRRHQFVLARQNSVNMGSIVCTCAMQDISCLGGKPRLRSTRATRAILTEFGSAPPDACRPSSPAPNAERGATACHNVVGHVASVDSARVGEPVLLVLHVLSERLPKLAVAARVIDAASFQSSRSTCLPCCCRASDSWIYGF